MASNENLKPRNDEYWDMAGTAYDLSSVGMGTLTHTVKLLKSGAPLSEWLHATIQDSGSNYINKPLVVKWYDDGFAENNKVSPRFQSNTKFIMGMKSEYNGIANQQKRYYLGGEDGLTQVANPALPIAKDETQLYLELAKKQGLLAPFENVRIEEVHALLQHYSLFYALREMGQYGINTLDEEIFLKRLDTPIFDAQFQNASVHKLGAMLAVSDEFTYQAAQKGLAIPASFKPSDPNGKREQIWMQHMGTPMPTFEELYKDAYDVFTKVADPNDPLAGYLYEMTHLPQLI